MDSQTSVFAGLAATSLLKFGALYLMKKNAEPKYVGRISRLVIYPIKSMRGLDSNSVQCDSSGLRGWDNETPIVDRSWMVTTKDYTFVTARQHPRLALVTPTLSPDGITLTAPDQPTLHMSYPNSAQTISAEVWWQSIPALDCGDEASLWISDYLQKQDFRLVYHSDVLPRRRCDTVDTPWNKLAKAQDQVGFQDGFPYMMMTRSSMAELNSRLIKPVSINHFRPNIIIDNKIPYDEDKWENIWIGETKFLNIKPCERCVMTTVDPKTGEKDLGQEPLRTLKSYRLLEKEFGESPCFGINLVLEQGETIKVGDPVMVTYKSL